MIMLCTIFFTQLSAQSESDIRLGKGGKLYQGSTVLNPKDVLSIMESDPEAHAAFKKAKANYDAAGVLAAIGGALIGYPIGTAIGGGDPQWGLAAGGVAIILIALPLNSAFKKNANIAIDLYNKDKAITTRHLQPKLHFGIQARGVGMALKF